MQINSQPFFETERRCEFRRPDRTEYFPIVNEKEFKMATGGYDGHYAKRQKTEEGSRGVSNELYLIITGVI